MLLAVLGWALLGLAVIVAASNVRRLAAGRAGAEPGSRSEAWQKLRFAPITAYVGLELAIPALDTTLLRWLVVVAATLFVIGELGSLWRARRNRKAGREATDEPGREPAALPAARPPAASPPSRRLAPLPRPAAGASGQEIAAWVERIRFSTARLRPGYDEEEVDVLLDSIRDGFLGVRDQPLTPDELRQAHFTRTRLRPGYDEQEVDAFLDEVGQRLAPAT